MPVINCPNEKTAKILEQILKYQYNDFLTIVFNQPFECIATIYIKHKKLMIHPIAVNDHDILDNPLKYMVESRLELEYLCEIGQKIIDKYESGKSIEAIEYYDEKQKKKRIRKPKGE